ncbi:class D beta-lactamase [Chitinimonas arctica]|uniref:beta-lactamase n=1 Tax=Chitinimonas arctica TaxID=2594795 RepID=A0A516SD55_9NEIS|nr:class D beta-lactamase [Chitinimonas arctica]QDQ26070.1 class D beta-lactamase [Chitinimonas arctica]
MRPPRHLLSHLAALALSLHSFATETVERPDLASHFEAAKVSGTFVLYDVSADQLSIYNRERAETRFSPASTFKIFNSLAGLESGAVKDLHERIPYGGQPQRRKQWEQDMNLRDAMRVSNVPVFQEVARRIGLSSMHDYLAEVGYGNSEPGKVVDRFWLDGTLTISAIEQARFAARLAQRQLPFSAHNMALVRDILKLETSPEHALFAKTGWAAEGKPPVGWWVGWLERGDRIYAFAINIDMDEAGNNAPLRQAVARQCLQTLKLL